MVKHAVFALQKRPRWDGEISPETEQEFIENAELARYSFMSAEGRVDAKHK